MEIGLGHLGYTPDTFWRLSFVEFNAAVTGYKEKQSGSRDDPGDAFMRSDLDALMAEFPDGDGHSPRNPDDQDHGGPH